MTRLRATIVRLLQRKEYKLATRVIDRLEAVEAVTMKAAKTKQKDK